MAATIVGGTLSIARRLYSSSLPAMAIWWMGGWMDGREAESHSTREYQLHLQGLCQAALGKDVGVGADEGRAGALARRQLLGALQFWC